MDRMPISETSFRRHQQAILPRHTLELGGEPLEKWKGQVMISNDHFVVGSCDELEPGDALEASYKGTLLYRGP
jgi:hypothetical protein